MPFVPFFFFRRFAVFRCWRSFAGCRSRFARRPWPGCCYASPSPQAAGDSTTKYNHANEVAVAAFLRDEVGFLEMSDVLEHALASVAHLAKPSLEQLFELDRTAREAASERIRRS